MTERNVRNGWALYRTALFRHQLGELVEVVKRLRAEDPEGYRLHPKAKLLASIWEAINERVPADPNARDFDATRELGPRWRAWRRVKKGLPERYRLFFKFDSTRRVIVYAWINDEDSPRKQGSRTDVYAVFKAMLARGVVPDGIEELLAEAARDGPDVKS